MQISGDLLIGSKIVHGADEKFYATVEVSYTMVHDGPYHSTTDSCSTSVGATVIDRFLRPVCYQNFPAGLLPPEINDANTLNLWRLRNGQVDRR